MFFRPFKSDEEHSAGKRYKSLAASNCEQKPVDSREGVSGPISRLFYLTRVIRKNKGGKVNTQNENKIDFHNRMWGFIGQRLRLRETVTSWGGKSSCGQAPFAPSILFPTLLKKALSGRGERENNSQGEKEEKGVGNIVKR